MHFFNFQSLIDFDFYKNKNILIFKVIFEMSEFFSLQFLQRTQNSHKKILEIIWLNSKKSLKNCIFVKKTNFYFHYMQIYDKILKISIFCEIHLKYANAYFPSEKLEKLALVII